LTKSKSYQGLNWFWKPDKIAFTPSIKNIEFLNGNVMTWAADPGIWYVNACIPLKVIFNFCNDYNKVMWGLKQRIRMTRTGSIRCLNRFNTAGGIAANTVTDALTVTGAAGVANDALITITTLRWRLPVVRPSPSHEQALLEVVGNNSQFVDVALLKKRTNSIAVPVATTFTWPLATTSGV